MCGIAGFFVNGGSVDRRPTLRRMTDSLRHRGPDDEGFYLDESVALGVRRLSIIDLETGRQPIANEDGTVWVVQNGEIYNFRELRASWSVAVTGSVPRRTRKFSSTRMNSTEVSSCPAWTACLPSPSGTPSTAP